MKVILQRDIPKLGKGGDIVNVADGFARNYLFPRQYAVAATGGALKEHNARAAREKEKGARSLQDAQVHASRLEGLSLTLIGKVGSGTKLYGSITAQDVAEAIARKQGVEVDKRRVGLADPIKNLGSYVVPVRLHSDITISVQVEVLTEEECERREKQAAVAAAAAAEAAAAATAASAAVEEAAPIAADMTPPPAAEESVSVVADTTPPPAVEEAESVAADTIPGETVSEASAESE